MLRFCKGIILDIFIKFNFVDIVYLMCWISMYKYVL